MLMNIKQRKIKLEPRVKLNYNNYLNFDSHLFAWLSISNSLDVISFTAPRVGEFGNKSMKARPSSND